MGKTTVSVIQSAAQRRGEKPAGQPPPTIVQSAAQRRGDAPGWILKEPCPCDEEAGRTKSKARSESANNGGEA